MKILKFIVLAVAASTSIASTAFSFNHPKLLHIIERAQELKNQGKPSVVLFDIDDTLVSTRERTQRILKEFALQGEIIKNYPDEARKLLLLKEADIKYELASTFKNAGIENAALLKAASQFWQERFFTNAYCSQDKAIPGSAEYLHKLVKAGAKIVYLTGRDALGMMLGTMANFKQNHFPADPSVTLLMLKPDNRIPDIVFKTEVFSKIAEMGEMIGVFENEPANLNAMAKAFPNATAVFVDSIHSPKPDVPVEGAVWIKEYKSVSQKIEQVRMCSGVF